MIAVVGIAAEARDRERWTNRRITRQRKPVEVAIVKEKNQEVHSGRERVAPRQRCQAEAGSFGSGKDFLAEEYDDLPFPTFFVS
jgi:hypothetical protein